MEGRKSCRFRPSKVVCSCTGPRAETAAPPRGSFLNLSFRFHQWLQNFPANCTRLLRCSCSLGWGLPVCPKSAGITTVHSVAHLQALNLNRNEELGGNQPIRYRAQALLVRRSSGAPRISLAGYPSSCWPASPTSQPCLRSLHFKGCC